jgi:hypothetical protein
MTDYRPRLPRRLAPLARHRQGYRARAFGRSEPRVETAPRRVARGPEQRRVRSAPSASTRAAPRSKSTPKKPATTRTSRRMARATPTRTVPRTSCAIKVSA